MQHHRLGESFVIELSQDTSTDRADHDHGPCPIHDLGLGSEEKPFKAALIFNDPGDWYRDLQFFTDVVMSGDHSFTCYKSCMTALARHICSPHALDSCKGCRMLLPDQWGL